MRLMIVEDSEEMRRLMKSLIAQLAEVICECSNGREAIAAYAAHRPDVVLMDIEMRDVDGICATKEITAAFPGAKIVVVTNYNDHNYREASVAAGACEYLLKEDLLDLKSILESLKGPSSERLETCAQGH